MIYSLSFALVRTDRADRHFRILAQLDRNRRWRITYHSTFNLGRHARSAIRKPPALTVQ